jgi:hypothetical protein
MFQVNAKQHTTSPDKSSVLTFISTRKYSKFLILYMSKYNFQKPRDFTTIPKRLEYNLKQRSTLTRSLHIDRNHELINQNNHEAQVL